MSLVDRVFAAAYDPMLRGVERAGLATMRRELLADLAGTVAELGAGTGANLAAYGPGVTHLHLFEPVAPMADRLRRTVAATDVTADVEVVLAPAEALPLTDGSVDTVVSTLVLCTVDDLDRTLAEVRRVLRPGGTFALIEHVGGDGRLARVQHGIEPVWKVIARGCHLTRDPRAALGRHGFDVSGIDDRRLPMPGPTSPGQVGHAIRP